MAEKGDKTDEKLKFHIERFWVSKYKNTKVQKYKNMLKVSYYLD